MMAWWGAISRLWHMLGCRMVLWCHGPLAVWSALVTSTFWTRTSRCAAFESWYRCNLCIDIMCLLMMLHGWPTHTLIVATATSAHWATTRHSAMLAPWSSHRAAVMWMRVHSIAATAIHVWIVSASTTASAKRTPTSSTPTYIRRRSAAIVTVSAWGTSGNMRVHWCGCCTICSHSRICYIVGGCFASLLIATSCGGCRDWWYRLVIIGACVLLWCCNERFNKYILIYSAAGYLRCWYIGGRPPRIPIGAPRGWKPPPPRPW